MTEVPEHLLKKAAEARARLTGQGGGDADAASEPTESAATPVAAAAATPAPAPEPEPPAEPEPDAPYVAAAKARKTIPYWVMPVLLFLPIWAIYYVGYLERPPVTGGLAFEGAEAYATCSGCHGVGGGGGSGRQLSDGEVTRTFPVYEGEGYDGLAGMIAWVANGSSATASIEGSAIYGDPDREGGPQQIGALLGNMSGFGAQLSIEELAAVVYHERSQFGALEAEQIDEEFEVLEEFIHVAEEDGVDHIDGMSVAEVHEMLEAARGKLAE